MGSKYHVLPDDAQEKTMINQMHNLLELLLIKNGIRLDQKELKLQLSSHPSYPSLHALTSVLDHFQVSNLALQLPANAEILKQLPDYFIAEVAQETFKTLALIEKQKGEIKITNENKETQRITVPEFLESWDGIIVAIEKDDKVQEQVQSTVSKLSKWTLILVGIFSLGYLIVTLPNTFTQLHAFLSVAGLALSVLIFRHELGVQSAAVNSFCNLSSNASCDAVLNSKGAAILGKFRLSDISILTFSTYLLYWMLYAINGLSNFSALTTLALLAIPITLISVYYQYRIVKKWCPLCLGIVGVLWLQAAALLFTDVSLIYTTDHWFATLTLFVSALVLLGSWNFFRPIQERHIALEKIELDHYTFKRNFSVFKALQSQGKSLIPATSSIAGEIVLGNRKAPLEIILVTSPLCRFCKKVHRDADRLLSQAPDKVKLCIRFQIGNLDDTNDAYKISARLLDIYNLHGEAAARVALHEVYAEHADPKQWLTQFKTPPPQSYDDLLQAQFDWCKRNGVNFTPDVYIAGKQLSLEYSCADLLYFVDDLIEQQQAETSAALGKMLLPENIFRER